MASTTSMHRRLTIILCGLVTVLGLIGSLATYIVAKRLASDFDTSLRSIATRESSNPLQDQRNPASLVLQIWEIGQDQHPIRSSNPEVVLPKTVAGMSQVTVDGELWNIFSLQAECSSVQIGELQSQRRHNAQMMAIGVMLPVLLLVPLMALVIGIVVRLSLRPLDRMGRLAAGVDLNSLSTLDTAGAPEELHPFLDSINRMIQKISTLLDSEKKFIANAAHELRTPMTALQLQLEALQQSNDEERQERFSDLQRGIVRTGSLISQLLGMARAEMGHKAEELLPISLPMLVSDVVADLLPLAIDRDVDLGVVHLEQLTMYAVETDMRVMLKNLIDNAIRYGGSGGCVDVSVMRQGENAVLEVTDNGPGIPEAQLAQVFERFFRGNTSNGSGSGLGLSIVATMAESYQGRVTLYNRSDGKSGAVARLELPLPVISSVHSAK